MIARLVPFAFAVAFLASACALLPKATPNPGVPCEQLYSEDDCQALVALATRSIDLSDDDVVGVNIAPNPTGAPDSAQGAAPPIRLRLTMKDGATREFSVCGGVSMEPVCSVQPRASSG
jgi:hypothetical protein